jgi:protein O-GlcNAc transferase
VTRTAQDAPPRFEDAVVLQREGDLVGADRICVRLLQQQPAHVDAWHLRGLLACQGARPDQAVAYIRRSLALNAHQPAAHVNIGNALLQSNQPQQAVAHFDEALRQQPQYATARYGRASALIELRRFDEALADLDRALGLMPHLPPALHARSQLLHQLGRPEEALECVEQALRLMPVDCALLLIRGNALFALRRFDEALASYGRAAAGGLRSAELLNNRGNALRELSRWQEALACYEAALALEPDRAETLSNRGNVMLDMSRLPDALSCYEQALRQSPDFLEALDNQGLALLIAGQPERAVGSYRRLRQLAPGYKLVDCNLFNARAMCCDWEGFDADCLAIQTAVENDVPVQPFAFLAMSDSPQLQRNCAEQYARANSWRTTGPIRVRRGGGQRQRRLRIAYVSADFRQHAVALLLAGVLEHHDPDTIEAVGVALRPIDDSELGRRVRAALGQCVDVGGKSDRQIAELLRALDVDVAVDLMGYTRWARPGVFAHRAAPIQVGYLGYPGTTGSDFIDYIVGDRVVIPQGEEGHYSECVVRLPYCYLPNDDRREVAPPPTRAEAGLPEQGLVFCAFTNAYKINPPVFAVWMRLLRQRAGSVLWLRGVEASGQHNLRRYAEGHGVAADRLIFAPQVSSSAEHLGRLSLADLYLDTLPYNAHSTACDVLWAGVPVLTCAGRGFASRVAASALTALGLTELITDTLEQYEHRALELTATEALRGLRARVSENRSSAALFDTQRYTRALESAYRSMHQRATNALPPASFEVEV